MLNEGNCWSIVKRVFACLRGENNAIFPVNHIKTPQTWKIPGKVLNFTQTKGDCELYMKELIINLVFEAGF